MRGFGGEIYGGKRFDRRGFGGKIGQRARRGRVLNVSAPRMCYHCNCAYQAGACRFVGMLSAGQVIYALVTADCLGAEWQQRQAETKCKTRRN